jgi:chemotaxis response regulator CheB
METTRKVIRVMVLEESPVSSRAIQDELGAMSGIEIVACSRSAADLENRIAANSPDLVIVGCNLEGTNCFDVFDRARACRLEMAVLLFDTGFRIGGILGGNELDEWSDSAAEAAAFVVATQLVPKVRALFRSSQFGNG